MIVTTEKLDQDIADFSTLAATTGTDPKLKGAKCILFTNTPALTKDSVVGDLTQPTFPGYASAVVTWSVAKRDDAGNISVDSGLMKFQMSDATVPTIVKGYGIVDSAGTTLLAAETFDAPVDLTDALSICAFVIDLSFNNADPGQATVVG